MLIKSFYIFAGTVTRTGHSATQIFSLLTLFFLLAVSTSYAQVDPEARWGRLIDFFNEYYNALNYAYDLMTTQRAYLFGHQMLSGAIQFLPIVAFEQFGKKLLSVNTRKSLLYSSLVFCSQVGMFIFWDKFSYEHNNWPFKDDNPLKNHRHRFGLIYYF